MILSIDDDKIYEITVTMIYYDYLPILVTDSGIETETILIIEEQLLL